MPNPAATVVGFKNICPKIIWHQNLVTMNAHHTRLETYVLSFYSDVTLTPHHGKGQTKPKWFFQANDSYKKRTNKFVFFLPNSTKTNLLVRFLEEFEDTKKSF